jgi:peptidoglycan/LPS O-acetylase OafA/YrhL
MSADRRIPSLDGLRALSISLVIFSHLMGTRRFPLGATAFGNIGDFGYLGVKVFFVISGYLITTLLIKEHERTGTISLLGFIKRRAWRIFPAFYVFIACMGAAWALGWIVMRTGDVVAAVTYTMNYRKDPAWSLGHIWSLSVEEQFYLLWPFLVLVAGRKRIVPVASAMIVLAVGFRAIAWYHFHSDELVEEAYPCVMDSIAVGCLMAGLRTRLDGAPRYQRFLRSPLFLVVPLAVAFFQYPSRPELQYLLGTTFENLALALIVDRSVRISDDLIGKLLNWAPLVWIGTLSYSLYLWQEPLLNHTLRSGVYTFPLNLVVALAAAIASYYLIERPTLALRDRRAARKKLT